MKSTAAEKAFAVWLTTQANAYGLPYKDYVANRYAASLRTDPLKLDIALSAEERDIYRCKTLRDFDELNQIFCTAPNFQEVNRENGHGTFSAGMSAYRRYVHYLECGTQETFSNDIVAPVDLFSCTEYYMSPKQSNVEIPSVVIDVLRNMCSGGFRFETTSISLLASASGKQIDRETELKLKGLMFGRKDGVFFLPDQITDEKIQFDLLKTTDGYLQDYGCFEISEVYQQFEKRLNPVCIKTAEDFESYYLWATKNDVRCVAAPQIGNRMVRYSGGNIWANFSDVAKKIVSFLNKWHYGSCTEEELHEEFSAFSKNLLAKIIRHCASDELVQVEINDTICYQSFAALGLPENFSEILATTLERLDEIGLFSSQETLHTALSLELGVNFKSEFSLPDWDTYRRLIRAYYQGQPHREWKNNIFVEVDG